MSVYRPKGKATASYDYLFFRRIPLTVCTSPNGWRYAFQYNHRVGFRFVDEDVALLVLVVVDIAVIVIARVARGGGRQKLSRRTAATGRLTF